MEQLANVAFYLGLVAYSVAATLFFVDVARREGAAQAARWAPRVLGVGTLLHGLHIVAASLLSNVCPVESLPFALSLSALLLNAVYLVLRRRQRIDAMGVAVAPIALTFLVGAQFVGNKDIADQVPRTLLALHITSNVLGLALFLLAGAAGAFYLVQERRLKLKRAGAFSGRLPALDLLDLTEHRLLLAGFPLLTFGVVSGAIFMSSLESFSGAAVLRVVLAYSAWLLVAAVLVLRALAGWRGRRLAYGTLAGVACVLLLLGVYIVRGFGGS